MRILQLTIFMLFVLMILSCNKDLCYDASLVHNGALALITVLVLKVAMERVNPVGKSFQRGQ